MPARSTSDTEASPVLTTNACLGVAVAGRSPAWANNVNETSRAAARPHPTLSLRFMGTSFYDGYLSCSILLPDHDEIVEIGLGIRLGPQADLAGRGNGIVLALQQFRVVQKTLDLVANMADGQLVPFANGHLDIVLGRFQLHALVVHNLVEPIVVFQRVHARDVVVVRVLGAPDDSAALVFLALDRLEMNTDFPVLEAAVLRNAQIEDFLGTGSGLGQGEARLGRGASVRHHFPHAALPFVRWGCLPGAWHLSQVAFYKTETAFLALCKWKSGQEQCGRWQDRNPGHARSPCKRNNINLGYPCPAGRAARITVQVVSWPSLLVSSMLPP